MKPKLKALAASLALAVASGQAGAVIRTGDNGKLFQTVALPGNLPSSGISYARDAEIAAERFASGSATSPAKPRPDMAWTTFLFSATHSAAYGFAVPVAFTAGGAGGITAATYEGSGFSKTGSNPFAPKALKAESNDHTTFGQHASSGTPPRLFSVGDGSDGTASSVAPTRFHKTVGSVPETFNSSSKGQFTTPTTLSIPEPGNWAMVLAGLLGVGAIARRRISS